MSGKPIMRKVFADANVLIAGTSSSSGASSAILRLGEIGIFQLVVSRQVLDETERNLRQKTSPCATQFCRTDGSFASGSRARSDAGRDQCLGKDNSRERCADPMRCGESLGEPFRNTEYTPLHASGCRTERAGDPNTSSIDD